MPDHFVIQPESIRDYIDEVCASLEAITDYEGPELSLSDKLNYMRETRHAFGRTALVLSGGGALGAFHIVSTLLIFSPAACLGACAERTSRLAWTALQRCCMDSCCALALLGGSLYTLGHSHTSAVLMGGLQPCLHDKAAVPARIHAATLCCGAPCALMVLARGLQAVKRCLF